MKKNIKKLVIGTLVAVMLLCMLTACGPKKVEGSEGLEYTLSDDGKYYTLTSLGTFVGKDVVVGNYYNGKPVKVIGENPFDISDNPDAPKGIETITISEGIEETTIFWCYSPSAKEIILPDGIKVYAKASFILDTSLEKLVIGKGLEKIEMDSFLDANPDMKIYFRGTEEEWNKVEIVPDGNEILLNAEIVFNYKD